MANPLDIGDKVTTKKKKKTSSAPQPEYLVRAQAANRARGVATRQAMIDVIKSAKQPLTVDEIVYEMKKRKHAHNHEYIRASLRRLVATKQIKSRVETPAERAIRRPSDGRGAHLTTKYFFVGSPTRRTAAQSADLVSAWGRTHKKKRTVRPAKGAPVQTDTSTAALVNRIVELENQLAAIRSLAK